jgi:hypothetical protein
MDAAYAAWEQELLNTVDRNIEMFRGYTGDHARTVLEELVAGRASAVQCFEGKIAWQDVPYRVRELSTRMPAWGTRGT